MYKQNRYKSSVINAYYKQCTQKTFANGWIEFQAALLSFLQIILDNGNTGNIHQLVTAGILKTKVHNIFALLHQSCLFFQ